MTIQILSLIYNYNNMSKNNISQLSRVQVVAVATIFALLFIWLLQTISTSYQKGVVDGKSMRITEINACIVGDPSTDSPNFGGCNSIL